MTAKAKPGRVAQPVAPNSFAGRLRSWRSRMGLTQPQAAEQLGVGFSSYTSWEGGYPCVLPETIMYLCTSIEREREWFREIWHHTKTNAETKNKSK